jgi:hypothetical protein
VGTGGLEQPCWDDQMKRFLITVPGKMVGTTIVTLPAIQVINPVTMMSEKTYPIDCQAIAGVTSVSVTGIFLRPNQHILASARGFPIILTLDDKPAKSTLSTLSSKSGVVMRFGTIRATTGST